jgi:Ca2+-binding RTX toxin-like protein
LNTSQINFNWQEQEGVKKMAVLFGTNGDDVLVGGEDRDIIYALKGNDTIFSGLGDDFADGGEGKDFFQDFGDSNDIFLGGAGEDTFFGADGNDILNGGDNDDFIRGGLGQGLPDKNDTLIGGAGDDLLVSDRGNDILFGDRGKDLLIGVDDNASLAGIGEVDFLNGGQNADRFALGNGEQVFYNDNDDNNRGLGDYAVIMDFSINQGDVIQLHGKASDYSLGASPTELPNDTAIFLNTNGTDELIGIVQGTAHLDLASNAFSFV